MDGTFGGGDLISASLAIMLGGTDAELHDKEVSLSTSQITGSQTAVFEYDPEDEDPQGTPPGPWDGYSLFTIDLSGVKEDIEDYLQQISDLEDELEDMQECCSEVVTVIHEYDPDYDPDPDPPDPTNPTIPEKIQEIIDEESGYEPPVGTPIEDILKIAGADDTVEIEGNTYHFDYYVLERNTDVRYPLYTKFEGTAQQVYSVAPKMDVYDNTNTFVTSMFIAGTQSQGVPVGYKYQITSTVIDYANKLFIVSYEVIDNWGNVITGTENNDISAYLDTTSPNPTYKIKNG